jgi:hypothetical protein
VVSFIPREYNKVIFGPSETITFAGFIIDTWFRWTCVMLYAILSQISISINVNTLEPYIQNVVRDHKTTTKGSYWVNQFVVQLKTSYDWMLGIFNTNLWVTLQVQFLAVALLTDLFMNAYMTHKFLNSDSKKEPLLPN